MVCGNEDGWSRVQVSAGHRIEASFGEGMAAGKTPEGQPGAFENAKANEGDVGVLRAGGKVDALAGTEGMEDRGQNRLIETPGDADSEAGLRGGHLIIGRLEGDRFFVALVRMLFDSLLDGAEDAGNLTLECRKIEVDHTAAGMENHIDRRAEG
jgi:hypothetical protein